MARVVSSAGARIPHKWRLSGNPLVPLRRVGVGPAQYLREGLDERRESARVRGRLARPDGTLVVALAGLLACAANAEAAEPAVFDVGAASVNINPDTPQYISGYGYKGGPTTNVHDPLEVRAFVVSNGTDAAAFVVADLTGWFSAYQGNLEPYGITHVREAAAAELEADGLTAGRGSVIVSSTHTHAAPVTTGIWGRPTRRTCRRSAMRRSRPSTRLRPT